MHKGSQDFYCLAAGTKPEAKGCEGLADVLGTGSRLVLFYHYHRGSVAYSFAFTAEELVRFCRLLRSLFPLMNTIKISTETDFLLNGNHEIQLEKSLWQNCFETFLTFEGEM